MTAGRSRRRTDVSPRGTSRGYGIDADLARCSTAASAASSLAEPSATRPGRRRRRVPSRSRTASRSAASSDGEALSRPRLCASEHGQRRARSSARARPAERRPLALQACDRSRPAEADGLDAVTPGSGSTCRPLLAALGDAAASRAPRLPRRRRDRRARHVGVTAYEADASSRLWRLSPPASTSHWPAARPGPPTRWPRACIGAIVTAAETGALRQHGRRRRTGLSSG